MKFDYFSPDIIEFIELLHNNQVRYLIVGGEAVIYYGYARLTGDIGFYYDTSQQNVDRLYKALMQFWDNNIPGIRKKEELAKAGYVIQFGITPNRIDLLNSVDGIIFNEAWEERKTEKIEVNKTEIPVYFIGLRHLILNKQESGRHKDLEDLKYLKGIDPESEM